MTTYFWKVPVTEHLVADGFITTAHWTVNAVDGEHTFSSYGSCVFTLNTLNIPYANVSEQNVLDWCWENGVDKTSIETKLQSQIDLLKNSVSSFGTPWVTA